MRYEIHHTNGEIHEMITLAGVDPSDEIAKWPAEMRATVAQIVPVDEFRPRPVVLQSIAQEAVQSLPLEAAQAMLAINDKADRANVDTAALDARILQLESIINGMVQSATEGKP